MVIIEDTRETNPLHFTKPYIDMVVRAKLDYGDYACEFEGERCNVVFERKSLPDLFGTLTTRYQIFKEEVRRCIDDGSRLAIIVESPLSEIYKGHEFSKVKGESIIRTMFTLMIKRQIPFVCCSSRREMALYISEFYYSWCKYVKERNKLEKG